MAGVVHDDDHPVVDGEMPEAAFQFVAIEDAGEVIDRAGLVVRRDLRLGDPARVPLGLRVAGVDEQSV